MECFYSICSEIKSLEHIGRALRNSGVNFDGGDRKPGDFRIEPIETPRQLSQGNVAASTNVRDDFANRRIDIGWRFAGRVNHRRECSGEARIAAVQAARLADQITRHRALHLRTDGSRRRPRAAAS